MSLQVLKNTSATLQETFSAGDADGTVSVTILRADGSVLVSGAAATHGTTGVYSYVLAPQSELDLLTVSWTGAWSAVTQTITTIVEIVGDVLFTVSAARAFGDKTLNNATNYPDADIRAARERITDVFEQVCGVSFIPRYARDILDGDSTPSIRVLNTKVNRVIAASVSDVALSGGELANLAVRESGLIIRKSGVWSWRYGGQNIVIAYEHGYPTPPPDITWAALMLCRYEMVSNDLSDRALSVITDYGTQTLVTAGGPMNNPTNLPSVNAVLDRYSESKLLIA